MPYVKETVIFIPLSQMVKLRHSRVKHHFALDELESHIDHLSRAFPMLLPCDSETHHDSHGVGGFIKSKGF